MVCKHLAGGLILIVPTLRVGMQPRTLSVQQLEAGSQTTMRVTGAERQPMHSHAERHCH